MKRERRHTRGRREGNFRIFRITREILSHSCLAQLSAEIPKLLKGYRQQKTEADWWQPNCSEQLLARETNLLRVTWNLISQHKFRDTRAKCDPTGVTVVLRPVRKRRPITTLTKLWRHNSCCVLDRGRCVSSLKLSQGAGAERRKE